MAFQLSGMADEAGKDLAAQIRAHQELGWSYLDLRTLDGVQFTDVSDAVFDATVDQLAAAGLGVSSFASGIANWATKISDPLEVSTATLARAIPRMHRLGTRLIRVMSWPNDGRAEEAWRDEAVRRMKVLARQAEDGGITIAVENCDGWASRTPANYARFFEMVGSPAVRAVYDTGNPASHGATETWSWYEQARPWIVAIHIKAHTGPLPDGSKGHHTWPDAGTSAVRETLADLRARGYDGFISIEPHVANIIHEGKEAAAATAYQAYLEYGRRLQAMIAAL